jgi:FtsP/CotA-like multicopper oxidase with cupredoxin domain
VLRPGAPATAIARLTAPSSEGVPRVRRGDELAISFGNALPSPALLNFRGNAVAANEPLLARRPVAPGGRDAFSLPQRFAGTALVDLRLSESAASGPLPMLPLVAAETEPVAVDRDEVLLIEDIRLAADGRALAPGAEAAATTLFTLNGRVGFELPVRALQRLRLRFINACHRSVIAIKIADHELRVMAIDGQPAEPFLARGGQLVLAPGTRVDAFVDALRPPGSRAEILLHDGATARPIGSLSYSGEPPLRAAAAPAAPALPSNGLPERLDLKSALRIELPLGGAPDWTRPADFSAAAAPVFRVKPGRTAVLALANPTAAPMVFHLHGHPFRLLDRLDDGWKPFWLDTLVVGPQQTERIAFAAAQPGRWLIEAMAAEWSAPLLLRSYEVA